MIKVGCCGYAAAMKKYHETFRLVELNSTFYQYPKMSTVEGWRKKAPNNFEFTVKAHQDISHKYKLTIEEECLQAFEKMKEICKTLKAQILVIQTPPSFKPDSLEKAKEFFLTVDRENLQLVWETRGSTWNTSAVREKIAKTLQKANVTHVTDPFVTTPAYVENIAYFRLHGLGKQMYYYQFTDNELKRLYMFLKPFEDEGKEVYVLFNNLSMFEDALRFKEFLEKGRFPSITGVFGMESVKKVIEKTRYPTTKTLLLKRVGWKLVELEENRQVRLEDLLKKLPSKTYETMEEVVREISRISI
jgi:uncharacterized protein YecE (DUF72 family)